MNEDQLEEIANAIDVEAQHIATRHRAVQDVLRWFTYGHLAGRMPRVISSLLASVAGDMIEAIPADDPELTAGLRKLLEAKDAFVRAAIAAQTAGAE